MKALRKRKKPPLVTDDEFHQLNKLATDKGKRPVKIERGLFQRLMAEVNSLHAEFED